MSLVTLRDVVDSITSIAVASSGSGSVNSCMRAERFTVEFQLRNPFWRVVVCEATVTDFRANWYPPQSSINVLYSIELLDGTDWQLNFWVNSSVLYAKTLHGRTNYSSAVADLLCHYYKVGQHQPKGTALHLAQLKALLQ